MKKFSKILCFVLVLALAISIGLCFAQNDKMASADELPALSNVQFNDNVLSWDAFADTDYYDWSLGPGGGSIEGTSLNLYDACRKFRLESDTYNVYITACDEEGNKISQKYTYTYTYTSTATKLATPTNLTWDKNKLSWTAVTNASYYKVIFADYGYVREVTDNYIYITGMNVGEEVYYSVKASSSDFDYLDSDWAESPKTTLSAVTTLSNSNVTITDKGIINITDAIAGVSYYEVSYVYDSNSICSTYHSLPIDIMGSFSLEEVTDGNYDITIEAFDEHDCPLTNEYTISSWEYDSSKAPQQLTGEINITGEWKYGETITATLTNSNNTGTLSYSWFKKDGLGNETGASITTNSFTITKALIGYQLMVIIKSDYETQDVRSEYGARIIKADAPDAPTGITATACTNDNQNDGTITGLEKNVMEYKFGTGDWNTVTATTMTGLSDGTYYIRYIETDTNYSSEPTEVVVEAYVDTTEYNITVVNGVSDEATHSKNTTVTIIANEPSAGYIFSEWTSSDGVVFANSKSEETTFTMLAKDVTVTANYIGAPLTGSVNITGSTVYGETLTANVTDSNNTGTFSYQWKRGNDNIAGATEETYTLTTDDIGRTLSVVVTSSIQSGSINSGVTAEISKIQITSANATITAPVAGKTQDKAPVSSNSSLYTIQFGMWYLDESPYPTLENDSTYIEGTSYVVRLEFNLVNSDIYEFSDDAIFTINGQSTSCYGANRFRQKEFTATSTPQYTITITNGTVQDAIAVEGATITVMANNPATGKLFDKWVSSDVTFADETNPITTFTMPAKDVTITATYKNIAYTITFDADTGAGTMESVEKNYGDKYTLPACTFSAPTGRQFKCWSIDSVDKTVGTEITITANVTIKAVWEFVNTYTVAFDVNGGAGSMNAVSVNGEYTLPENTMTAPEGKEFKCWLVNGTEYNAGAVINVTANTVIKAVWADKIDPQKDNPTVSQDDGLSGGAVAGIVIGSLAAVSIGAYFGIGLTLYKKGKLAGNIFKKIYKWIK